MKNIVACVWERKGCRCVCVRTRTWGREKMINWEGWKEKSFCCEYPFNALNRYIYCVLPYYDALLLMWVNKTFFLNKRKNLTEKMRKNHMHVWGETDGEVVNGSQSTWVSIVYFFLSQITVIFYWIFNVILFLNFL